MKNEFELSIKEIKKILKRLVMQQYMGLFVILLVLLLAGVIFIILGATVDKKLFESGVPLMIIVFALSLAPIIRYFMYVKKFDNQHDIFRFEYVIREKNILVRNLTEGTDSIFNSDTMKRHFVVDNYLVAFNVEVYILPNTEDIRKVLKIEEK